MSSRIVAGAAGGRRLVTPKGPHTRPTSQLVRGALFASLGPLGGARVLDLYAGSGGVGLEALSRGARLAVLVESERSAVAVLRTNVDRLGLPGAVVVAAPVARTLAVAPSARPGPEPAQGFDLVFLDPPYDEPVHADLEALLAGGWLAPGADVVVERATRDSPLQWPLGWGLQRSRRYGDTTLWYLRAS